MIRIVLAVLILWPAIALGQTLPATHAYSGFDAASSRVRFERGGHRPYAPPYLATGMYAPSAMAFSSSEAEAILRPTSVLRVVRPAYRLAEANLGIADEQDVIFFGETRLVRLRFHLAGRGQSLADRWSVQLRRYFDFLDRDNDGTLNEAEAEFVFTNKGVQMMLQSGFSFPTPNDAGRTFAAFDLDRDGKISFEEFAAYYAPSAHRVVQSAVAPARDPIADTLTDQLFQLFDTNKDGKLSRAELNAVESLFATLDADEDECLTALEIVPRLFNGGQSSASPRPAPALTMTAHRSGAIPDALVETILAKYDRDKNLRLSKAESPFDPATFAALDLDGNGEISLTELLAWKNAPPDLELDAALGGNSNESRLAVRPRRDGQPTPLAAGFKPTGLGTAVLTVGTQTIQLSCYTPTGVYVPAPQMNGIFFADNGKGYLTESDIGGPQFQALRVLFDTVDRDADGRMTRAEFDAFVRVQRGFAELPLTLAYAAQTPSLFQLIDTNGDGRLSVREVRTAWDRLIALEPGGKDFVTRAALQPQGAVQFGRSEALNTPNAFAARPIRQPARGPLWFRKLDLNGDGELSRREFPGTAEEFDRLDANRDGYISADEAEAADKKLRAAK